MSRIQHSGNESPSWNAIRFRDALAFTPLSIVATILLVFSTVADQRVRFNPKFTTGESFRYQVETRTNTTSKVTTPIANPEGGSQSSQSISLMVRLDVLGPDVANDRGRAPAVRLRATYERSQAGSQTDAYDPAAPSPDQPYNRLQGHSIEFTIEPDGEIADFQGLEGIFPNRSETDPILSWLKRFSPGVGIPGKGISIGQKWSSERPLSGMPLSDLIWRSHSTYLRNEPCGSSTSANPIAQKSSAAQDPCAVMLTRFQILRHGSSRSDATPPDYLRNGLRTAGKWEASGESLDSVSLVNSLLVRSTQTSTQDVDYLITSASSGSAIHQVSHATTQSEIILLPASQPVAPP